MNNKEILTFTIFLIHSLSEFLGISPSKIYQTLSFSKILDGYIIPNYDVLHTLGKEYLMEDIISLVNERGLSWER